jgi:hypothetical protein
VWAAVSIGFEWNEHGNGLGQHLSFRFSGHFIPTLTLPFRCPCSHGWCFIFAPYSLAFIAASHDYSILPYFPHHTNRSIHYGLASVHTPLQLRSAAASMSIGIDLAAHHQLFRHCYFAPCLLVRIVHVSAPNPFTLIAAEIEIPIVTDCIILLFCGPQSGLIP